MQVFSSNANFSSNIEDIREYTLGDPRVICRILSDNLYSNKIGSIVRELSANALDAHRMLGKEDVPFEVCLPGLDGLFKKDEAIFSIRDFGPGLNEEDIYGLYTSYGSSSKRSDNGQIGGFGIGSKSPFAYADMFTVTSWNDGLMAKYLCFLNKEGSPCIKKLAVVPSDEPSGMKVEIAVRSSEDAELFRKECETQYPFYDVPPAGGWTRAEPVYENAYGKMYAFNSFSTLGNAFGGWRNSGILYGHVNNSIYRLSWNSSGNDASEYGMTAGRIGYNVLPFQNVACILDIDGSMIDLSASREEMAFTERTKEAIRKAWSGFIVHAWKDILDDIDMAAETSRFEAIWKWKAKGLNFSALRDWITCGYGSIRHLSELGLGSCRYMFPLFFIECEDVRNRLLDGLRGYEGTRSSAGNPLMVKMGKAGPNPVEWILTAKNTSEYSNETAKIWNIALSEEEDFRLVFVNKDATFALMKGLAKDILKASPRCLMHFYALDGEQERKRIVEAYGNPGKEHVLECILRKEKSSAQKKEVQERKEQVKVRINASAFMNRSHMYSSEASDILSNIRSGIVETWLTKDKIESFIDSGGMLLVTNGTELSEKWNLRQKMILEVVGRMLCHKENVPKRWMLVNEASYSKLLSLGFKPLTANDSRKIVRNLIENIEIDWNDFKAWLLLEKHAFELKLEILDSAFGFVDNILPDHMDSPFCKAYAIWKRVNSQVDSKMSRTGRLVSIAFDESYGFFEEGVKNAQLMIMEQVEWGRLVEWVNDNEILQLVGTLYNNAEEKKRYAEILKKYLVWRQ